MPFMTDRFYGYVIQYGTNIIAAILIFFIGKYAAVLAAKFVERLMRKGKINETLTAFSKNCVYFLIITFVVLAALNKVGIETNSFLAVIGAAGLAVGLALQGSLANFAAGVMLIIFQPFKVGDFIEAGGAVGSTREIQIFHTIIMTDDNKKVIVPNSKITGDKITIYPPSSVKG